MNPLFEREWRSRWRRFRSVVSVGALVLLVAPVLYFLVIVQSEVVTSVTALQMVGGMGLQNYQIVSGFLLFVLGLLIGATSMTNEQEAGTFDALLLCPFGPRGIIGGKIASGAAFLSVLILVLSPLLALVAPVWLIHPGQLLRIELSQWLLMVQGLSLGVFGGTRARSLGNAISEAVFLALLFILNSLLWAACVHQLVIWIGIIPRLIATLSRSLLPVWASAWMTTESETLVACLTWMELRLLDLWLGTLGVGVFIGDVLNAQLKCSPFLIMTGQAIAISFMVRWSIWQLAYRERDISLATILSNRGARKQLFLNWRFQLSPEEQKVFALRTERETSRGKVAPVRTPARAQKQSYGRWRLLRTRWLQRFNPVLWLDLQRCLSLRAPHPMMQLPLLVFAALGGSMVFAVSLATLISLGGRFWGGSRADLASLTDNYKSFEVALCYLALVCGPFFGAMGFVIERRSQMLHELRLTLLSARAMWWGKFASRACIPLVGTIPGLAFVAFYAFNLPGHSPYVEIGRIATLIAVFAIWSTLSALVLSYHAPSQLAAGVWSLLFFVLIAAIVWPLAPHWNANFGVLSPVFVLRHESFWAPCVGGYGLVALLAGLHLFRRLRRAGFG